MRLCERLDSDLATSAIVTPFVSIPTLTSATVLERRRCAMACVLRVCDCCVPEEQPWVARHATNKQELQRIAKGLRCFWGAFIVYLLVGQIPPPVVRTEGLEDL